MDPIGGKKSPIMNAVPSLSSIPATITPEQLLYGIIAFSWITFLWDNYLAWRQIRVMSKTSTVPSVLLGVMDQETLTKAKGYNMEKMKFGLIHSLWGQCLGTLGMYFFITKHLWTLTGRILVSTGLKSPGEITQTLAFVLIGSVISTILDLPWSLYSNFVIEERHGFNKQTIGFYLKDKVKKLIVSQAILNPILAVTIYIIQSGGDYFFIYLWIFVFAVTIIMMTIYPDFIAPLFDKYTPLPEGELRSGIESLAESIEFPLKKLYVVDGSKRSAHSNAYFYGFYKNKRIVLFDTLIEGYKSPEESTKDSAPSGGGEGNDGKPSGEGTSCNQPIDGATNEKKRTSGCNNEEVIAVLAHELGHWKMNHVLKNLIISEINLFLCFMVFGLLYKNKLIYASFGFMHAQPIFIGLMIIFQYIFSLYNEIMGFLMMILSRKFEFEADSFAKHLNKVAPLRSALIKLNKDNLSFPIYDHLYSMWNHSHPPLLERLDALGKVD